VTTIGREELKAKIDSWGDVGLVETLDPEYYEDAHLPGAVNLPLDRIGELAPEILPDKDADIVVYCMSSLWPASEEAARSWRSWGTRT
jgi:rhodanese-related sulfurtransferase